MKVRIKGNAVRMRLSRPEVDRFAKEGLVEEQTEFEHSTFTYAVRATAGESMSADFTGGNLTIGVPEGMLRQWAATGLVGLRYNMPVGQGRHLLLLVEKDFKCIDADVTEDQSDFFENPQKAC